MSPLQFKQLNLNLKFQNASLSWQRCFVNATNKKAASFLQKWPDWPNNLTIIKGGGANFLCKTWSHYHGAFLLQNTQQFELFLQSDISAMALNNHYLSCVFIKDIDKFLNCDNNKEEINPQETIFHTINKVINHNRLHENLIYIAISATSNFDHLINLKDLDSRLKTAVVMEILPPDEEMLVAMLNDILSKKQINVNKAVFNYLIMRLPRDCDRIEEIITEIEEHIFIAKQKITIPLIKKLNIFNSL